MLDFHVEYTRVWDSIKCESRMVLATTRNNIPSARTLNVVFFADKVYFQTDRRMEKAQQIRENPYVALCTGKYQIQGICKDIGHPLDCKNEQFAREYKAFFPHAYEKYSFIKYETVFEVSPSKIIVWKSEKSGQTIEILFLDKKIVEERSLSEC